VYSQLTGTALGCIDAALSICGIVIPFADLIGDGLKKVGEIAGTATDAVGNAHVKSLAELRGEMEETLSNVAGEHSHPNPAITPTGSRLKATGSLLEMSA
jgi:hypothetical protein